MSKKPNHEVQPTDAVTREAQELRRQAEELRVVSAQWSGLLPHPHDLEAYDRIVPGVGREIIDWIVGQTTHREGLETKVTDSNIKLAARGQIIANVIVLAALGVCLASVLTSYAEAGLGTAFASIAAMAGVFIDTDRKRASELNRKTDRIRGRPSGESQK